MHSIREVDVGVTRRPPHRFVPRRESCARMAAHILLADVRLGFYDQAREARAIRLQLHEALAQQSAADFKSGAIEIAPI